MTRRRLFACPVPVLLAALVAGPGATPAAAQAVAQAPPQGAPASGGSVAITGTVVDSLHDAPLTHAVVAVDGTNQSARTDSTGAFRIEGVAPGPFRLGVFHPLLDSLGIGLASKSLTGRAGETVTLTIATPSVQTITANVCRTAPPPPVGLLPTEQSTGPGVIIGRVLDADTENPITNAIVELTWVEFQASQVEGFHRLRHRREAVTGPGGDFALCYVPLKAAATLRAQYRNGGAAAAATAVSRDIAPNGHLLTLVTMHLPAPTTPTIASLAATATAPDAGAAAESRAGASPAQAATAGAAGRGRGDKGVVSHRYTSGNAVLTGRVVNRAQQPLPGAQAYVLGAMDTATTDAQGHFALHRLPSGTRTLVVRSVGFQPVTMPVELTAREPRDVVVPFAGEPVRTLQPVVITARYENGLKRVGFDHRRALGQGTFWTAADIDAHKANEFHDLFTTYPGIRVDYGTDGHASLMATRAAGGCIGYAPSRGGATPTPGQNCGPCLSYVVDGQPYDEYEEGDMDTFVRPEEIGAIEIYQDNQVPRSISGVVKADCLNVIVWTKAKLGI